MLRSQSRCDKLARASMTAACLSLAFAFYGESSVRAQNAAAAPAAAAEGTNAPEATAAPQDAPTTGQLGGRPFGFTHDEFADLSETYVTNPLGLNGYVTGAKARS